MARRPAAGQGFTLLELLLVLALAALAAMLLAPSGLAVLSRASVGVAARELAADLRAARAAALERQAVTAMLFHPPEPGWRRGDLAAGRRPPLDRLLAEVPASERGEDGAASIRFFPDGGSSGGRIVLLRAGRRADVAVDWLTGRVEVRQ